MLRNILNNSFLHRGIFLMFGFITLCSGALSSSIDGIPEEEIIESSKRLVFYRNAYEYAVVERPLPIIMPGERPTDEEVLGKARTIIDLILAGPTEAEESSGIFSAFPEGTTLTRLEWDGEGNLTFYFNFPSEFLSSPLKVCGQAELMFKQLLKSFICLANINGFFIMAYDEKRDDYRPLYEYCLPEELKQKRTMMKAEPAAVAQPAVYNVSRRQGALSGKTIYIWPGHGYTISTLGGWGTQRPNCYNLCEDYIDIETMAQYLARYCYNAGAFVVMNRERDFNPNMVIVDNEVASSSAGIFMSGGFTLEPSETILDGYSYSYSSSVSYPLTGNNRPFIGVDHSSIASSDVTTSATWIPNIPEDGYYSVYVSYGHIRNPGEDNPDTAYVTDAHYIVKHAGDTTEFRVNQQRHQCTWVFLGEFYFYQGINPDKGAVILDNQSNDSVGLKVSADAVRFGGGMGNVARSEGVSGFRRWEEATKYYAQFGGAIKNIFHYGDDQSDMNNDNAAYCWWPGSLHQNGEDAVWLRFHTNAMPSPNTGTGTETFADYTQPHFQDLCNFVHDEVINDIRRGYYANWVNRRKVNSSTYYPEIPYILFELAFHDTEYPDNTFLKDPKFRQLSSRAICQGLVKFFANKDGRPVHLSPDPPRSFMVRNTPAGIRLRWDPPETDTLGLVGDAATSYVVYLSNDGKAWDNGRETVNAEYTFTGLTLDTGYYFRVTAINEGGESFPTKTLSARVAPTGEANILIVDGYDRLDRYCLIRRDGMPSLGTIYSMELSKMNMFDNIIRHARAIENYGAYFDSADKMAIVNGMVQLDDYTMLDWLMGKQGERVTDDNAVDFTFNDILRSDVENFLLDGGALFVSGTDIGYDLDSDTNQTDPESIFFNEFLKGDYVSDDLDDYWIKGAPGGVFENISTFRLDDANYGLYDADSPDVLATIGESEAAMTDASGSSIVGVQYIDYSYQLIYCSFPFETIIDEDVRNEVMRCVLDALLFPPTIAEFYWQLYQ